MLLACSGVLVLVFLRVTENLPAREAHLRVQSRDNWLLLRLFQPDEQVHVRGELSRVHTHELNLRGLSSLGQATTLACRIHQSFVTWLV